MGWIEDYLSYVKDMESPKVFHLWSAIAAMGHVLGRKTWVDRGGKYKVYPGQIMVILVARSAIARKSTAIRMIMPFVKYVSDEYAWVLPRKLSPQQLLQSMHNIGFTKNGWVYDSYSRQRDCCGLIRADELGTFFTAEEFAKTLPTHICDFNDAPSGEHLYEFRKWAVKLWNPCVGMLAATTPRGFAEELPAAARTAGFLGRTITVYGEPSGTPNPLTDEPTKEDIAFKDELASRFNKIAHLHGPFTWSERAKKAFEDFYYELHEWTVRNIDSGIEADDTGYYGRKADHAIRVAMVFCASESYRRVIDVKHLYKAIDELEDLERTMSLAFAEMGSTRSVELENKIVTFLERDGGWVQRWKLVQAVRRYGTKRMRDDAVENLREAREIEIQREDGILWVKRVRRHKKKRLEGLLE